MTNEEKELYKRMVDELDAMEKVALERGCNSGIYLCTLRGVYALERVADALEESNRLRRIEHDHVKALVAAGKEKATAGLETALQAAVNYATRDK